MGLDMYMFLDEENNSPDSDKEIYEPNFVEVAYWRKHPDLHRFLESEWLSLPENKDKTAEDFNGLYYQMTPDVIEKAMFRVTMRALPKSKGGFFFGESLYDKEGIAHDKKSLSNVLRLLKEKKKVYYFPSW